MNKQIPIDLLEIAISLEEDTYLPEGRELDGSPYSLYYEQIDYYRLLRDKFFGLRNLQQLVRERSVNEPLANENCGNWLLWTLLNELNVSRVRE